MTNDRFVKNVNPNGGEKKIDCVIATSPLKRMESSLLLIKNSQLNEYNNKIIQPLFNVFLSDKSRLLLFFWCQQNNKKKTFTWK